MYDFSLVVDLIDTNDFYISTRNFVPDGNVHAVEKTVFSNTV